jgi:ribulose-phosphate 3-epimerase
MKNERQILPSILSANFANLELDIRRCENAGAKTLHIDIMDGHFVPNISFGPGIVKTCRRITKAVLDTHLMIQEPDKYLNAFQKAGTDLLTVHVETCDHLDKTISRIRELGMRPGVTLNPATSLTTIEKILPYVDLVLIMSVNPGFGGQKYIPTSSEKIRNLRSLIKERHLHTIIEVDGGIDQVTIGEVKNAGAEYIVAGNAIFKNNEIELNYKRLEQLLK